MGTLKQEVVEAISKLPETVSIDDIIKELLHIKQEKDTVAQHSKSQTKPVSCLELMKSQIGCIEGPEDLSTNNVHMEKYGT